MYHQCITNGQYSGEILFLRLQCRRFKSSQSLTNFVWTLSHHCSLGFKLLALFYSVLDRSKRLYTSQFHKTLTTFVFHIIFAILDVFIFCSYSPINNYTIDKMNFSLKLAGFQTEEPILYILFNRLRVLLVVLKFPPTL